MPVGLRYVATQSSEVDACGGYTRNAVTLRAPCTMTLNSGAPDAWKRHGFLLEEQ